MLLSLIAVALGAAIGGLAGGSWRHMAGVPVKNLPLLLAGVACESAAAWWGSGWAGFGLVVAGFALLLGFAASNLALTGMLLVLVGLLSNLIVIVVNEGMPVRGVPAAATFGPRHHGLRPGDHLTGLADVVHLAFLGQMISAGDIVLAVGVATVIAASLRPTPSRPATGSPARARPWAS